jgi:hypothetical protein
VASQAVQRAEVEARLFAEAQARALEAHARKEASRTAALAAAIQATAKQTTDATRTAGQRKGGSAMAAAAANVRGGTDGIVLVLCTMDSVTKKP